jgi:hypothetical protein
MLLVGGVALRPLWAAENVGWPSSPPPVASDGEKCYQDLLLMPAQPMIAIHPGYQPKRLESGAPGAG